jgi:hypothetical protein
MVGVATSTRAVGRSLICCAGGGVRTLGIRAVGRSLTDGVAGVALDVTGMRVVGRSLTEGVADAGGTSKGGDDGDDAAPFAPFDPFDP